MKKLLFFMMFGWLFLGQSYAVPNERPAEDQDGLKRINELVAVLETPGVLSESPYALQGDGWDYEAKLEIVSGKDYNNLKDKIRLKIRKLLKSSYWWETKRIDLIESLGYDLGVGFWSGPSFNKENLEFLLTKLVRKDVSDKVNTLLESDGVRQFHFARFQIRDESAELIGDELFFIIPHFASKMIVIKISYSEG